MRHKFGWDLPPGVSNRMIEEQAGAFENKKSKITKKSRYQRTQEKIKARGAKEGRNHPSPEYEGQIVTNIYCPALTCTTPHASMTAKKRTIAGKDYIVWVYDAPCLEKIHKQVLRSF